MHTCGAWSQGTTLLSALSTLDGIDLHALGYGSDGYYHAIAEALKLALADREAYVGDPDFVDVPVEQLVPAPLTGSSRAGVSTRCGRSPACRRRVSSSGSPALRGGSSSRSRALDVHAARTRRWWQWSIATVMRAVRDTVRYQLGYAGGARYRACHFLARCAVLGSARSSLVPGTGQASATDPEPLPSRGYAGKWLMPFGTPGR